MTALNMPVRADLPWRRMGWVTWRRHRLTVAGVAGLLGAVAVYLVVTGLRLHQAYALVTACRPVGSGVCKQAAAGFFNDYAQGTGITAGLLQVVPALIGAFAGAPVLARELETGTFRYAWTQGFGRARWTAAMLVPPAVAVTLGAAAFSVLFSWCFRDMFSGGTDFGPLAPTIFDMRGIAFAAWTLAAFSIGALAGMLIRRVVAAMTATLAVYAGLAVLTGMFLRARYQPPLVTTALNVGAPDWVISQDWTQGGRPVDMATINQALQPVHANEVVPGLFQTDGPVPEGFDPVAYLARHGFTQLTTYQPVTRFWEFQWIEGGWLLALSVLLIGLTVWLVRRRAS